jgi:hypothetical protein
MCRLLKKGLGGGLLDTGDCSRDYDELAATAPISSTTSPQDARAGRRNSVWAIRTCCALLAASAWTASCGGEESLGSAGDAAEASETTAHNEASKAMPITGRDAAADAPPSDALTEMIPERTGETNDVTAHGGAAEAASMTGRDAPPSDAALAEGGAAALDAGVITCAVGATRCIGPGEDMLKSADICLGGRCLMPAGFPGCGIDADCVPGGCLHGFPPGNPSGSICMGTAGIPGVVSCGDEVLSCSTDIGCSITETTNRVCGRQGLSSAFSTFSTCDGPSDCPAGQDCCVTGMGYGNMNCFARTEGGVSSGCPSATVGGRRFWVCDPQDPSGTCPQGLTCKLFDFATGEFTCSP